MKKVLSLILALCLVLSIGAFATDSERVTVFVGGEKIKSDVTAKIVNSRTMLPLRAVFEAIGAKVSYEEATETVTAEKGDTVVKLVIGSDIMTVNGEEKKLDVAAYTENGRTMVPVRACAEAFDLKVDWFDDINTVRVRQSVSVISKITDNTGHTATYQYNEDGNEIYFSNTRNYWKESTYDENENLVLHEDVNGEYTKYTYNGFGDLVREEIKDEEGAVFAYLYEYDENGNNTFLCIEGYPEFWAKYQYDERNKVLRCETYNGSWKSYTYDGNGNLILLENSDGEWTKKTYDENGNLTFEETSSGQWAKLTYDENGNNIYKEDSSGNWVKREYDENGNMTYEEDSAGTCYKYVYDDNGNMTSAQNNDTHSIIYEIVVK